MLSEMGLNVPKKPKGEDKSPDPNEPTIHDREVFADAGPSLAMIAVVAIAVLTAVAIVIALLYSR
jgi:hypothetical protein